MMLLDKDFNSTITLLKAYGEVHNKPYHVLKSKETNYNLGSMQFSEERIGERNRVLNSKRIDTNLPASRTYKYVNDVVMKASSNRLILNAFDNKDEYLSGVTYHSFTLPIEKIEEQFEMLTGDTFDDFLKEYVPVVAEKYYSLADNDVRDVWDMDLKINNTLLDVIVSKFTGEIYLVFSFPYYDYDYDFDDDRVVFLPFYVTYDYDDADELLENIIKLHEYNLLPHNKVIEHLADLWFYQLTHTLGLKEDLSIKKSLNDDLLEIYKMVEHHVTTDNKSRPSISFYELFDFFKEVEKKELTQVTQKAQEFINYQTSDNLMSTITNHENFKNINEKIKKVDKNTFDKIVKMAIKDHRFKGQYFIENIYEINPERDVPKGYKRMSGAHGSNLSSILSILLNSLRTVKEMNERSIQHRFHGQALGHGVYFANTEQISKACQYLGTGGTGYFFIADLDYDPKNVKDYSSYGYSDVDTSKYSMIRAEDVSRWGYSEYVMPHSEHINLRYLVQVKQR